MARLSLIHPQGSQFTAQVTGKLKMGEISWSKESRCTEPKEDLYTQVGSLRNE
jgi:hypothetical protein